jgi:CBS domain-containing protein
MSKAYEVMTHLVATCGLDAHASDVAATMRDLNIGNVLVVEDGKLCGIVTDRDLTIQALTGKDDPQQTPVRKYMTDKVVTGEPAWSLEQVAHAMGKHQIRRLPIVQAGQLVGIISLGDIARHNDTKYAAAKSLQAISAPTGSSALMHSSRGSALPFLALTALATGVIAWLTVNHSGQALRKQIADSELYHSAQDAVSATRDKVDEAAQSKAVRELRDQMHSKLTQLSAQVATLQAKPKRKHSWFS